MPGELLQNIHQLDQCDFESQLVKCTMQNNTVWGIQGALWELCISVAQTLAQNSEPCKATNMQIESLDKSARLTRMVPQQQALVVQT